MLTTPVQVVFLRKITLLIVQIDAGFLVIVMLLTFFSNPSFYQNKFLNLLIEEFKCPDSHYFFKTERINR